MHAVGFRPPIQWTGTRLIWNGIKITRMPSFKKPCSINFYRNAIQDADGKRVFSLPRSSRIKPELLAIYAQITGVDLDQLLIFKDCEILNYYGMPTWIVYRQQKVLYLESSPIWNNGLFYSDYNYKSNFINGKRELIQEPVTKPWIVDGWIYNYFEPMQIPIQEQDRFWLPFVHHLLKVPCPLAEFLSVTRSKLSHERSLLCNTWIKDDILIRRGSRRIYVYSNGLLVASCLRGQPLERKHLDSAQWNFVCETLKANA